MSSLGREWHERGVRSLERLTGLQVQESLAEGGVRIAVFPGLRAAASRIVRDSGSGAWAAGVGSWMVDGTSGAAGLERLLQLRKDPTDLSAFLKADGAFGFVTSGGGGDDGEGKASSRVIAVTDALGSLHLYGMQTAPGCFQVSTSSLGLAATARPAPGWDEHALQHFFSYGNVFGVGRSLFRGIGKLPPASVVEIGPAGIVVSREYWKIEEFCYDGSGGGKGDAAELAAILERILRQIGSHGSGAAERPILDLTGGFDSRAVFGAMLQAGERFQTVTVGGAADPDVVTAQRIAHEFGCAHERRERFDAQSSDELWKLCRQALPLLDGEANVIDYTGALRTHLGSADRGFGASVNGSVGEICKGQWWEALLPFLGRKGHWEEDTRKVAEKRFAVHGVPPGLLVVGTGIELAAEFTELVRGVTGGVRDLPNTAVVDLAYLRLRMQHWQGRFTSATQRVWPCWSPFGFREVLELALSSPPERRVRHRLMRRLIEAQSPRLAAIPLAAGYPATPLRWNTVHRFWPLAVEVGEKVLRRVKGGGGGGGGGVSAMGRLWEVEEVREMLDPAGMRSLELYERGELGRMLERSRNDAGAAETVGRILTLEMAARALGGD